jgi:hypothetical protein
MSNTETSVNHLFLFLLFFFIIINFFMVSKTSAIASLRSLIVLCILIFFSLFSPLIVLSLIFMWYQCTKRYLRVHLF